MNGCLRTFLCRLLAVITIVLFVSHAARGQDQAGQVKRLAFLAGSWRCAVHGPGVPDGIVDELTYTFTPDWSWMIETSHVRQPGKDHWSTQLWGYDARDQRLVAYQFDSTGVSTKTVEGWVEGRFQSRRDDNGSTVVLDPSRGNAFDWTIKTADGSKVITESCTRSR